MIKRRLFKLSVLAFAFAFTASAPARTVNTASMIATVVDQNGAVVKGANVSVVNTATGARREGVSGDEGTATIAGLALTGEYKVHGKPICGSARTPCVVP